MNTVLIDMTEWQRAERSECFCQLVAARFILAFLSPELSGVSDEKHLSKMMPSFKLSF